MDCCCCCLLLFAVCLFVCLFVAVVAVAVVDEDVDEDVEEEEDDDVGETKYNKVNKPNTTQRQQEQVQDGDKQEQNEDVLKLIENATQNSISSIKQKLMNMTTVVGRQQGGLPVLGKLLYLLLYLYLFGFVVVFVVFV